ncbi:MAG: hypothetical protein M3Q70_02120 [bacterium]|nr:hypothetical protein [bacterium]
MSVLYPSSAKEWENSLSQVGYDDVVASVMPRELAQVCADPEKLRSVAKSVASVISKRSEPIVRVEPINNINFGLHYDIQGTVPELSTWFNNAGSCEWFIRSGGSRDKAELYAAIDEVGIEVSPKVAASGTVANLNMIDKFDRINFSGLGGLVFAAGLTEGGDRIPAMHQISGSQDRSSFALYELIVK